MRTEKETKEMMESIEEEMQRLNDEGDAVSNYTEIMDYLETKWHTLRWVLGLSDDIFVPF